MATSAIEVYIRPPLFLPAPLSVTPPEPKRALDPFEKSATQFFTFGGVTMTHEEVFRFCAAWLLGPPLEATDLRRRFVECVKLVSERSIDMEHHLIYCGLFCVEENDKPGTSS